MGRYDGMTYEQMVAHDVAEGERRMQYATPNHAEARASGGPCVASSTIVPGRYPHRGYCPGCGWTSARGYVAAHAARDMAAAHVAGEEV